MENGCRCILRIVSRVQRLLHTGTRLDFTTMCAVHTGIAVFFRDGLRYAKFCSFLTFVLLRMVNLPSAVVAAPALTPARRTESGIALASYPSPACDEPRRVSWVEELASPRR
jgi:hypothetical protein